MREILKTILRYAVAIVAILALSTALRSYVFTVINVSGASMVPTLHNENMMILNRLSYKLHDIERFDIVVVERPMNFIIKRVIGLPGEQIEYRNSELYVDGERISEPYIVDEMNQYTYDFQLQELPGGYTTIPEGMYLVLGDNRMISEDSRAIGLVSEADIIGKTNWVVWPPKEIHIAQ